MERPGNPEWKVRHEVQLELMRFYNSRALSWTA